MRAVAADAEAPPLIALKSQPIGITMALVTLNSSHSTRHVENSVPKSRITPKSLMYVNPALSTTHPAL
jgi:hypothetical protein